MNKKGGNALGKSNVAIHCFPQQNNIWTFRLPALWDIHGRIKINPDMGVGYIKLSGNQPTYIKQSPSCVESGPH